MLANSVAEWDEKPVAVRVRTERLGYASENSCLGAEHTLGGLSVVGLVRRYRAIYEGCKTSRVAYDCAFRVLGSV